MDKTDGPDTSRPVRISSRTPRKARSGGSNRVVGRRSATPTDVAGEALSPEVESGYALPTLDVPPPTRRGERPVADRAPMAVGAVRAADQPFHGAPGEVEARAVLGDLPEETGLSDEAEMHLRAERRRARIAEAAYYRAERRGFAPGGEEQDWFEAEAEIDRYGEDVWPDERAAPPPG